MTQPLTATVFGSERYLRIWFRTNGTACTLLAPDRRIAAAPYALQAEEAVHAAQADYATQAQEAADAAQLGGQPPSRYFDLTQDVTVTGRPAFNGGIPGMTPPFTVDSNTVVTSLNAYLLDGKHASELTYTAGQGLSLFGGQFSITSSYRLPQACANGQIAKWNGSAWVCASEVNTTTLWSLTGNSGTTPGTNFLGTTDNAALEFKVNSARALRLEPSATSPNVIGGHSANNVMSGAYGATIGGGGIGGNANRVTDNMGTVGGGIGNQAGNSNALTSDAAYATVGGGYYNIASSYAATVGGGSSNVAGGIYATASGGYSDTASGEAATVGGGRNNTASGNFTTIPGGSYASATQYGQMSYASGSFSSNLGTAQSSTYILRNTSSGTTLTYLFLDGSSQHLTIANGRTVAFHILVVGQEDDNGESAGYEIRGVVENINNKIGFVGRPPSVTVLGEDDGRWDVSLGVDTVSHWLYFYVQGGSGDTIRWVAVVNTVEVQWG